MATHPEPGTLIVTGFYDGDPTTTAHHDPTTVLDQDTTTAVDQDTTTAVDQDATTAVDQDTTTAKDQDDTRFADLEDQELFDQYAYDPEYTATSRPDWKPNPGSLLHLVTPPASPTPSTTDLAPSASTPEPSAAPEDRPPPHYNPYPYKRTWRLLRPVMGDERYMWYHRDDEWMKISTGGWNVDLRGRIFNQVIASILQKQHVARRAWEEEQLHEKTPPVPLPTTPPRELEHLPVDPESLIDHRFDLEFRTATEEQGVPLKTLLSGRRAIERNMHSPKGRVFENYYQDNIWVRIKWPAYPDHEPARSILVSLRTGGKVCRRRPCTRLELSVALAALVTRFYNEVSAMEPHPAFEHLALGSGEDRISLYGLRVMGLQAAENGLYDLQLDLDTPEEVETQASSDSTDGVKIIEPSWSSVAPVTCTVAPPPKVPYHNYFTHLTPETIQSHIMPVWREQ